MTAAAVRVGLVGLGAMGMGHLEILRKLHPWVDVVALADCHRPFLERAAEKIPDAAVYDDPVDCVAHAGIDAVVVATTDETHHTIIEAGLTRGVHVLCEKPLTTTAERSLAVVNAERVAGRRLVQIGFMRRYDQDYRHIREMLRSGRIGDPILITQRHRNPLAVNTFDAQKMVVSSAAHDIDVFRWLTDDEVEHVGCCTTASADGATLTVLVTLQSRSGVLGIIELSRGPGLQYEIGLDIVGGSGALTLGRPPLTSVAMTDRAGAQRLPRTWIERFAGAYHAQDVNWLTGVATHRIDGPSAYDGYATNVVIDAAIAALRSGRSVEVQPAAFPVPQEGVSC